MARIVMEEQQEFAVLPEDSIVVLKVDEVEIREVDGARGTWQKMNVKFKVLDIQSIGDGRPVAEFDSVVGGPIYGNVPFRLTDSPENKLRQWLEAIFNMSLQVGFELDTDLLLGKTVRGVTSNYRTSKKDPATNQGYLRHQVESLLPYGGAAAAAPAASYAPAVTQQDPWATEAAKSGYNDEPPF